MANQKSLLRQSHFLGTKIRNLRKSNNLTMEDLSTRCMRIDPQAAPSVSYLSMIETGKRVPAAEMLEVIAQVFQKDPSWFLDGAELTHDELVPSKKGSRGGIAGMALEPGFLFAPDILQIAIPELLSQTGTGGRQFAQLLIRAHQEHHQNHFPELERAAEEIGQKRMPLAPEDLLLMAKKVGLQVRWFTEVPAEVLDELGVRSKNVTTSYFMPPSTLHLNRVLELHPTRLKYELAVHIGHAVLHNKDAVKSSMTVGGASERASSSELGPQDMLHAWRDFESSFFAGALLCPKLPFRQLLDRHGYEISSHQAAGVSASVAMRRMTAVSPYPHWHYFDAYTPGKLKAVYRGNGIPLPWGNMRQVEDPCQHWAVFRMFEAMTKSSSAQLSLLQVQGAPRIYCCESTKVFDLAGNPHVLCAGIDLNPAISAQGIDADELAMDLQKLCVGHGGAAAVPASIRSTLTTVSNILNINWVARSLDKPAQLICSRGNSCPREPGCYQQCSD